MSSRHAIVVCEDCGTFTYENVERVLEDRECPACGSANLIHGFTESAHPNVVFTFHHDVVHVRPKPKLTNNPSALARLILVLRSFITPPASRQFLKRRKRKVREAPGTTLLRIADFLYSPATVEKIFKQEIADWRVEYYEALKNNQTWKARWISCRHYWAIAKAVSLDRVVTWFDRVLRRI